MQPLFNDLELSVRLSHINKMLVSRILEVPLVSAIGIGFCGDLLWGKTYVSNISIILCDIGYESLNPQTQ